MKVAILFPKIFDYPFTYKSEIVENLKPGDFVKAPFGSNEITGIVWPQEQSTEKKFILKTLTPSSSTFFNFDLEFIDGPKVATIFVFLFVMKNLDFLYF